MGLFGSGKGRFALAAGAGFVGGAVAGVYGMQMYHRYKMYQVSVSSGLNVVHVIFL